MKYFLIPVTLLVIGALNLAYSASARHERKWKKNQVSVCFAPTHESKATTEDNEKIFKGFEFISNDAFNLLINDPISTQMRMLNYFLNNTDLAFLKTAIKNIVNKNFNLEQVGIEFVGWETCPYDQSKDKKSNNLKNIDAIIFLGIDSERSK